MDCDGIKVKATVSGVEPESAGPKSAVLSTTLYGHLYLSLFTKGFVNNNFISEAHL